MTGLTTLKQITLKRVVDKNIEALSQPNPPIGAFRGERMCQNFYSNGVCCTVGLALYKTLPPTVGGWDDCMAGNKAWIKPEDYKTLVQLQDKHDCACTANKGQLNGKSFSTKRAEIINQSKAFYLKEFLYYLRICFMKVYGYEATIPPCLTNEYHQEHFDKLEAEAKQS